MVESRRATTLNGICPYFTMFPLDFPYSILSRHAEPGDWVMDPFCGRGTTNYACRLLDMPSIGIDSSSVAVALSQAKLANTSPSAIVRTAHRILESVPSPTTTPTGEFWDLAFDKSVLLPLCRLRDGLLRDCRSDARKALRAILMGALHGPQPKRRPSYLSNQAPRTYAPKPRYAVKYWKAHNLAPPQVDVLEIIAQRAERYYANEPRSAGGMVVRGDSRESAAFRASPAFGKVKWVITSPPYYGMRTYIPDQWLRYWFVGGPPDVCYSTSDQLSHASPNALSTQLRQVWRNVGAMCISGAQLIVRFGGINDRKSDPMEIIRDSLAESGWSIVATNPAGLATGGRRQAIHFMRVTPKPVEERDIWATWQA